MDLREWADGLIVRRAWVLHTETLVVGPVKNFFDGEATKYKSTIDGVEVPAPVLELENGHGLRAVPELFIELAPADMRFYMALQQALRGVVELSAKSAAATGVEAQKGFALTISALRAQLVALETTTPSADVIG